MYIHETIPLELEGVIQASGHKKWAKAGLNRTGRREEGIFSSGHAVSVIHGLHAAA